MDITLALTSLVLLAPMLLIVAATLRVVIGRPFISEQKLIGFGGQVFTAYQFRTISEDETIVTCLGTHGLDKLPRLFNILRGDMSFVGPQPLTTEERNRGLASTYFLARPGLIGLQHTRSAHGLNGLRRAALDRHYVRRWSLGLDLILLIKSVAASHDQAA